MKLSKVQGLVTTLVLAHVLSGCSAKISADDGNAGGEGTQRVQDLKPTPKEQENNPTYNEIDIYKPTAEENYYFTYRPQTTETVYIGVNFPVSLNCGEKESSIEYLWQEINANGEVLKEHAWKEYWRSFSLYSGQVYRLRIRYLNFETCLSVSHDFSLVYNLIKSPPQATKTLREGEYSSFYLDRYDHVETYDLAYSNSARGGVLYFPYIYDVDSRNCHSNFKREIYWLTLNAHDQVVASQIVATTDNLPFQMGQKYVLRFQYHHVDSCNSDKVQEFKVSSLN